MLTVDDMLMGLGRTIEYESMLLRDVTSADLQTCNAQSGVIHEFKDIWTGGEM
jgi:hypothetical protein